VNVAGVLLTGGSADPVTRPGAQAAARAEVAKSAYHRDDPSWTSKVINWVVKRFEKVLDAGLRHAPGHTLGSVLVVIVVTLVIVVVVWRVGVLRRTAHGSDAMFDIEEVTAQTHRERARRFAADGDWAETIREYLRAIARELEQRGVLDPRPGRTAGELARDAGVQLPALADDLRAAAAVFDAVWYGGRTATATDGERLRALDATVAGSHRALVSVS
jgi:Domain of unknown function (DUF4129)